MNKAQQLGIRQNETGTLFYDALRDAVTAEQTDYTLPVTDASLARIPRVIDMAMGFPQLIENPTSGALYYNKDANFPYVGNGAYYMNLSSLVRSPIGKTLLPNQVSPVTSAGQQIAKQAAELARRALEQKQLQAQRDAIAKQAQQQQQAAPVKQVPPADRQIQPKPATVETVSTTNKTANVLDSIRSGLETFLGGGAQPIYTTMGVPGESGAGVSLNSRSGLGFSLSPTVLLVAGVALFAFLSGGKRR